MAGEHDSRSDFAGRIEEGLGIWRKGDPRGLALLAEALREGGIGAPGTGSRSGAGGLARLPVLLDAATRRIADPRGGLPVLVLEAVANTLRVLERELRSADPHALELLLQNAVAELEEALVPSEAGTEADEVDTGVRLTTPPRDLAQIAATLIGLAPTDRSDLQAIQGELARHGERDDLTSECTSLLARAAQRVGRALSTTEVEVAEDALAEVGRLLDRISADLAATQAAGAPPAAPVPEEAPHPPPPMQKRVERDIPSLEFDSPPILSAEVDADILVEAEEEFLDLVNKAESGLLELEDHPEQEESLNRAFRAFHTLKGSASFLGLDRIQRLAHFAENILSRARSGEIRLVGIHADLTLKACDVLRAMVEVISKMVPGREIVLPTEYDGLLRRLAELESADPGDPGSVPGARYALEEAMAAEDEAPADVLPSASAGSSLGRGHADSSIRVSTHRLDSLINTVGELVIAHSMIAQDPSDAGPKARKDSRKIVHLGKITRELQDLSMALRMVPLKPTFEKARRAIRDLSRKSGKPVVLHAEGEDTEIDRTMVEGINDPLVHMIRNAVDHGIESPAERRAAGKSATGTVTLRAHHAAGNVVIEVEDDGRGLDRGRILEKAIERGIVPRGTELSDAEVNELVFRPGFTTADQVSDMSGRGVGMDVVKRGIEALRGRVGMNSVAGKGTVITMQFPLTMAIVEAMLVVAGGERYLLPTMCIQQSFHPEPGDLSALIGRGELVKFRGGLVPVFRMHDLLGVTGGRRQVEDGILIVVDVHDDRFALLADDILGQQQVVIKSLGSVIGRVPGIAGGAILGDGHVGLILDAKGILSLARREAAGDGVLVA